MSAPLAHAIERGGFAVMIASGFLMHFAAGHPDRALRTRPLFAQAPSPAPPPAVTGTDVGLGLAICGVVGSAIGGFWRDRQDAREKRARREQEERDKRFDEMERRALKAEARAANTRAHLAEVLGLVRINSAGLGSTDAKADTALEELQLLRDRGWIAPSSTTALAMATATGDATAPPPPPPLLLIVEDDPETARALTKLFARQGFRVEHAASVADASAKLDARPPDWVILDLKLADGEGTDVLRKVRSDAIPCRVAVISGAPEDSARLAEAVALAPDALFRKPVDFGELMAAIQSAPRSGDDLPAAGHGPGAGPVPKPPEPTP